MPHGRLALLPFAVLPVASAPRLIRSAGFEEYRGVEWMIKRIAVVQLPSVAALISLRGMAQATPAAGAFVGFGDPVFARGQGAETPASLRAMSLRNLRIDVGGDQARPGTSANFRRLPPLPDTAQELKEIAVILKASDDTVLLGERATPGVRCGSSGLQYW